MNYRTMLGVLRAREKYWANNAVGTGDNSTDTIITRDPNDYLAPLAGNKFYQIIAIIAVLGLVVAVAVLAGKKSTS